MLSKLEGETVRCGSKPAGLWGIATTTRLWVGCGSMRVAVGSAVGSGRAVAGTGVALRPPSGGGSHPVLMAINNNNVAKGPNLLIFKDETPLRLT